MQPDGNSGIAHAALHGIIKRIDDPFWDKYMPPNGWGGRCEAIQLPGSAYKETPDTDIHPPVVSPMFQINFGKQGLAFPVSHAYFKEMPSNVWRHLEPSVRSEVLIYYKDLARQTMPTMGAELTECANLQTGKLKRNANARDSVLDGKHARTVEEVKAVRYAWNNPDKLQFERVSPMGEHKNMTNEAHIRNLSNKAKRRVVEYLQYSFDYKGQTYHIKLERLSDGFEQFYSLTKP